LGSSANPAAHLISARLIDSLYAEALLLADEARDWFDRARHGEHQAGDGSAAPALPTVHEDVLAAWPGRHDPGLRIALSCESLRLTTRLMHIIAWLLLQRAAHAREITVDVALAERNRLGASPACDADLCERFPEGAQRLVRASLHLYERVRSAERHWRGEAAVEAAPPAVHAMLADIEARMG
jgi:regulator of CtrA degradation